MTKSEVVLRICSDVFVSGLVGDGILGLGSRSWKD